MKPLRLAELVELLQGVDFAAWWSEYQRATHALREAEAHAQDLEAQVGLTEGRAELVQQAAIDALAAVGALEDEGARLSAEAQAVENESLDAVAAYEEQRQVVSQVWLRLGGAERETDDQRRRVEDARSKTQVKPARKARDAKVDLADAEGQLSLAGKKELGLDQVYRREDLKKAELWREVERLWARSLELSLLVAERASEAKRRHREAERLFREAEERKARGRQLKGERDTARKARDEAARAVKAALERARQRFACIAGERFLYFARSRDGKGAFAVPLQDDAESYGTPVKALAVYAVDRQHGVARLVPAREPAVA
jgi:hypothetical protein